MSIPQANNVADYAPDGSRFHEVVTGFVPEVWGGKVIGKPGSEDRSNRLFDSWPDQGMGVTFFHLLRFLFDVLHFTSRILLFPVFTDDALQSRSVLDPFDQTSVATQRHDSIRAQLQIPLSRFAVIVEHFVAEDCKIDESLFFAKVSVFITFQQKVVDTFI